MLQTHNKHEQADVTRSEAAVPTHCRQRQPSSWSHRIPACLLAVMAAGIAGYLALYQWRLIPSVWDPVFGNQTMAVLDSAVSNRLRRWLLIPDAALGAMAYLSEAILALAGSRQRWWYRPWLVALFGINVIPLGIISVVLVVLQGTVVGSWCFPCMVAATLSLILVYLVHEEIWSCLVFLYRVRQQTGSWSVVWQTFWGRATPEAVEVARNMIRSTS